MNHRLGSLFVSLFAAVGGFALTYTLGRSLRPSANPVPLISLEQPVAKVEEMLALPLPGVFSALSPSEKWALSERFPKLNDAERSKWLADAMGYKEPERTSLLSLIVLDWARTNPAAAGDWALAQYTNENSRAEFFHDVIETWVTGDAESLLPWWEEVATQKPPTFGLRYLQGAIQKRLYHHNPLAYAAFQELSCVKYPQGGAGDHFQERHLATPEQIATMAAAVAGKVAYNQEPEAFRLGLEKENQSRHANKKNAWNSIFEQTAVAWHRQDSAACDAWLQSFPEAAQQAARHFIAKSDSVPLLPSSTPVQTTPRSLSPEQRITMNPPTPGPAEDAARKDWANWWRTDPVAAEAFLNDSAWSEDLKFRARAKAYAGSP